jgi:hypothetical protein
MYDWYEELKLKPGVINVPLHTNRQLITTRHSLDSNIFLLDTSSEQALLRARNEVLNDSRVPASVDDGNAQTGP